MISIELIRSDPDRVREAMARRGENVPIDDILELETADRLDDLRHISSVLTIVDGNIVYSDGNLINCRNSDSDGVWYRKQKESR